MAELAVHDKFCHFFVSDLMVEVFGEAGRHARFAVGTNALPRNVATEADAVFEIK